MDNIPLNGEILYNPSKKTIKIGDGSTPRADLPTVNSIITKGSYEDYKESILQNNEMFCDTSSNYIYFGNGHSKLSELSPILRITSDDEFYTMLNAVFGPEG